jgi:hypothetical protein
MKSSKFNHRPQIAVGGNVGWEMIFFVSCNTDSLDGTAPVLKYKFDTFSARPASRQAGAADLQSPCAQEK